MTIFWAYNRGGAVVSYPSVVVITGTQVAWDRHINESNVGYRGVPSILNSGNVPNGWQLTTVASIPVVQSVTHATPAVLASFDTNGRPVNVIHPNRTVRDCKIWVDPAVVSPANGVSISTSQPNIINTTVEFCTIEGEYNTNTKMQVGIMEHTSATGLVGTIIRNCKIGGNRDDAIKMRAAAGLIEKNLIKVGGFVTGAHWDGIDISNAGSGIVVQDNFIDSTFIVGSEGRTSAAATSIVTDVTYQRNIMGFGADTIGPGVVGQHYSIYSGFPQNANIRYMNNVFEFFTGVCPPAYGITAWTNNRRYTSGVVLSQPAVADTQPSAFTFTDVTGATNNTVYLSNTITITGINTNAAISITGGEYSINGGAFVSTSGLVANNQTVQLRVTSSSNYSTAVSAVLTVDVVTDTYTVTTAADPIQTEPTGYINDPIMNYFGPSLSLAAEANISATFANWQSKRDTWRVNNRLWSDTIASYGYCAEGVFNYKRGGVIDNLNDAYSYLTGHSSSAPTNEPHSLLFDYAIAAANGAPNSSAYDTVLQNTYGAFYYDLRAPVFLDFEDIDWTARYFARGWAAMLCCNYRGFTGGGRNYLTAATEYKDFFINNLFPTGGWKANTAVSQYANNGQTKFYTLGMALYCAFIHHKNITQQSTLLDAMRTAANFMLSVRYQKNAAISFSMPYTDRQIVGEGDWRDGDAGTTNNGALPNMGLFFAALGYLGYQDRNSDYFVLVERMMDSMINNMQWNNTTDWGPKEWDETFTGGSWTYSYYRQKQALRAESGVPRTISGPTISGSFVNGQTLTFNPGSWTNSPTSHTYKIYSMKEGNADNTCGLVELTKTTPTTFILTASQVGKRIYIVDTATNANGNSVPICSTWSATVT